MTLLQMSYIMEIYNKGSMNKAAQALYVSQSTISGAIKEVEEELGIAIFRRSNKGIELTDDGAEFISQIKPMLEQNKKIHRHYADRNLARIAKLSISSQRYPFCAKAFVEYFNEHQTEHMDFAFKESEMDKVISDVSMRKSEIGIVFLTDMTEKFMNKYFVSRGLEFYEIKRVHPKVFLGKGHPLAKEKEIKPESLFAYPCVVFEKNDHTNINFSEEIIINNKYEFNKIIFINDRATAYNILSNTDAFSTGSGVLPEGYCDNRIVAIPLVGEGESMRLGYIKLADMPLTMEATGYIKVLKNIMSEF